VQTSPSFVDGGINLRGLIIPVVDLIRPAPSPSARIFLMSGDPVSAGASGTPKNSLS
jgi:hypothetical protein